ncbi:MAG TPA: DinB family protein, partial [Armatimonadota bacterium]|nr:DinB family protein [Armatimonadota bacterium]
MIDPIEQAKQWTREGKSRFLNTFAFVPDDKLTWTPSPTALSALRIAAHVGVTNQTLAGAIAGEALPTNDPAELSAMGDAAEKAITTREAAVRLIEES